MTDLHSVRGMLSCWFHQELGHTFLLCHFYFFVVFVLFSLDSVSNYFSVYSCFKGNHHTLCIIILLLLQVNWVCEYFCLENNSIFLSFYALVLNLFWGFLVNRLARILKRWIWNKLFFPNIYLGLCGIQPFPPASFHKYLNETVSPAGGSKQYSFLMLSNELNLIELKRLKRLKNLNKQKWEKNQVWIQQQDQ